MKRIFDVMIDKSLIILVVAISILIISTPYIVSVEGWNKPIGAMSPLPAFLAVTTFLLVLAAGILVAINLSRKDQKNEDTDVVIREISYQLGEVKKSISDMSSVKLEREIDKKKEKYINIPNISFHFADEERIINFYNDYFKEPTIEQVVNEIVGEIDGTVKTNIPQLLEAKVGGKDINKWISTIRLPDISVSEMFRRWQRETIKNGQVALGLELVEINLSDVKAFNNLILRLEKEFGLKVDDDYVERHRSLLRNKAANKIISRLEKASGMVLVEGKFKIMDMPPDFYKLVFEHPVNEYLAEHGEKVTITVIVRKDTLYPNIAGNYAQSIGRSIPITVYGKIWQPLDREENIWELQISPLAIY